ncbi:MAG: NAD(P)-dependent oxidoreductase [Planctomycetes bacterium]|nr:NAD(P)-dependent oxidoreductase [Planctomycetota bacterium]
MKVLVTGGTGFVGGHLVERLLQKKYEVHCVCRNTSNLQHLKSLPHSDNLKFVNLDISNPASYNTLTYILKDADYVYHLAGLIKAYRAEDYDQANFLAAKYLIEAMAKANNKNLKRFLHLSSLAAAGPSDTINGITEDAPCRPISYYGQSKLKGEIAVKSYDALLPITILRPPPVYGPRDSGLLFFFQAAARGIKPQFNHKKHISLIYVHDLIDATILAAEDHRAIGQTYFVANKEYYSINEVIKIISNIVNKNAVSVKLSDGFIKTAAEIYEGFCYILGREPSMINSQKVLELSQNYWTCLTEKIRIGIGFGASTPIEKGLKETANWYSENGWI